MSSPSNPPSSSVDTKKSAPPSPMKSPSKPKTPNLFIPRKPPAKVGPSTPLGLQNSSILRTRLIIDHIAQDKREHTAARSFLTIGGLGALFSDKKEGFRRRLDFGRLENDLEVYDFVGPAGEVKPHGVKRLVVIPPKACAVLKDTLKRPGRHNALVTSSEWVATLCKEGPIHIIEQVESENTRQPTRARYCGCFTMTDTEDALEPSDWEIIGTTQRQYLSELWHQQPGRKPCDKVTGCDHMQLTVLLLVNEGFNLPFNDSLVSYVTSCVQTPNQIIAASRTQEERQQRRADKRYQPYPDGSPSAYKVDMSPKKSARRSRHSID